MTAPAVGGRRTGSGLLRRHAWFLVALALGVAVRATVMVAYRPALIFPDSLTYLNQSATLGLSLMRPSGYPLVLALLRIVSESLTLVVTAQHLLGLGLAVACYAFLLRRELPAWAAAAATLPLLLDPLQLVLEHYVLSDVLFEGLLVVACLLLLWRRRPGPRAMALAGLAVGGAALVRGAGSLLLVAFLVAVLCLRLPWTRVAVFVVAVALPVGAYVVAFHQQHGQYAVTTMGPHFLYARLAPFAECSSLPMPTYERPLCPAEPVGSRPDTNTYMWGGRRSTQWHLQVPPGVTQVQAVRDFDQRVVRAQPMTFLQATGSDLLRSFSPLRTQGVSGYLPSDWLFEDHYWSTDPFPGAQSAVASGSYGRFSTDHAAARTLTVYRKVIFTPGPLMAALFLVALAAAAGVGRARWSGDRVAVGLLSATCAVPVLTAAAISGFSWRYQLPQIGLLPVAGALGLTALIRGPRPGTPAPLAPLRPLDRTAARLARLRLPEGWRRRVVRAVERGWCQAVLAVVAGCVVGLVALTLADLSGWFGSASAAVVGLVTGVVVAVGLLVSRRRNLTRPAAARAPTAPGQPAA